jgi:hypothetical protein
MLSNSVYVPNTSLDQNNYTNHHNTYAYQTPSVYMVPKVAPLLPTNNTVYTNRNAISETNLQDTQPLSSTTNANNRLLVPNRNSNLALNGPQPNRNNDSSLMYNSYYPYLDKQEKNGRQAINNNNNNNTFNKKYADLKPLKSFETNLKTLLKPIDNQQQKMSTLSSKLKQTLNDSHTQKQTLNKISSINDFNLNKINDNLPNIKNIFTNFHSIKTQNVVGATSDGVASLPPQAPASNHHNGAATLLKRNIMCPNLGTNFRYSTLDNSLLRKERYSKSETERELKDIHSNHHNHHNHSHHQTRNSKIPTPTLTNLKSPVRVVKIMKNSGANKSIKSSSSSLKKESFLDRHTPEAKIFNTIDYRRAYLAQPKASSPTAFDSKHQKPNTRITDLKTLLQEKKLEQKMASKLSPEKIPLKIIQGQPPPPPSTIRSNQSSVADSLNKHTKNYSVSPLKFQSQTPSSLVTTPTPSIHSQTRPPSSTKIKNIHSNEKFTNNKTNSTTATSKADKYSVYAAINSYFEEKKKNLSTSSRTQKYYIISDDKLGTLYATHRKKQHPPNQGIQIIQRQTHQHQQDSLDHFSFSSIDTQKSDSRSTNTGTKIINGFNKTNLPNMNGVDYFFKSKHDNRYVV